MSVAHQLGYFDQMHMIRDFHCLSGKNPNEVFQQIGDYQPWSLALPSKLTFRRLAIWLIVALLEWATRADEDVERVLRVCFKPRGRLRT